MHTLVGDLWSLHARGYTLIIPTEGLRAPSSQALLNTKHARIAALRFPHFGAELGNLIAQSGHHSYYFPDYQLITLPISPDEQAALLLRTSHASSNKWSALSMSTASP